MVLFFVASAVVFTSLPAYSSPPEVFSYPESGYDPSIPEPGDFLGHKLGTRFTSHRDVVGYLERLAEISPRCRLYRYGRTYEGRELVYLVISSPENVKNVEELRAANLRLADPSFKPTRGFYDKAPIFVWLSFCIHGNEASSTETALALSYHLAADTSGGTSRLLDETVVIIDPLLNPDGRERYVAFYTSRMGAEPDGNRFAWEHDEPWPSGRFNHYLFDLNRDWSWLTQIESKSRVKAYLAWKPQVHVDFHEMYASSSYFFFPPAEPLNPNYPLHSVKKWTEVFGEANARAFDERGWAYFTEEEFDMFYPGYGDSWPTFHGATGMTYEQAGHSRAGLLLERRDGVALTLADRMEHHFLSALTTIETAAANRAERLESFHEFFVDGVRGAGKESVKAYVLPAGKDPAETDDLVGLLLAHGIEVLKAEEGFRGERLYDMDGRRVGSKEFSPGTYVVPMAQPLRRFAKSLIEPETELPDTFFYDITAWSLPLAYGVEAFAARKMPRCRLAEVTSPPRPRGGLIGSDPLFGFLVPWTGNGAPRMLSALLERGFYVRFAAKSFRSGGRDFGAGTLIVPAGRNPDSTAAVVQRLAGRFGVQVYAASSGRTSKGIDLGSNKTHYIKPVTVGVLGGPGTNPTSLGAVWFLLDRVYRVKHSVIDLEDIARTDLSKFDVLILPDDRNEDGEGKAYDSKMDSSAVASVKDWVRRGGVFIGLGGGAAFACKDHAGLSSVCLKKKDGKKGEEKEKKAEAAYPTLEEKRKKRELDKIPGTVLRVKIDQGHPLAFGYDGEIRIIKTTRTIFEASDDVNVVGYFPDGAKVAGFISRENEKLLAGTPYLVEERVGKGHVVLYLDDPDFRLFWHGLDRLFLNGIYFMPAY
jgi:hypothetical protein